MVKGDAEVDVEEGEEMVEIMKTESTIQNRISSQSTKTTDQEELTKMPHRLLHVAIRNRKQDSLRGNKCEN